VRWAFPSLGAGLWRGKSKEEPLCSGFVSTQAPRTIVCTVLHRHRRALRGLLGMGEVWRVTSRYLQNEHVNEKKVSFDKTRLQNHLCED
jgi:hypothetical protein